jgi:hypothetical protein
MALYRALLIFLAGLCVSHDVWHALPKEVNAWWRQRTAMRLVRSERGWHVVGHGSERARIAFVTVRDGRVVYRIARAGSAIRENRRNGEVGVEHDQADRSNLGALV